LPAQAREAVLETARLRSYALEEELIVPGRQVKTVAFPTTLVCSVMIGLRSGQRAEMGIVGSEGFIGIPAVLGAKPTEYVIAHCPGEAYELTTQRIVMLSEKHKNLQQALLQYVGYAYHVAKQTTVCNAYHAIEQRLARWLLMIHDRLAQERFPMTQELLSHMVAATRPRVTEAAARLRAEGIIDYQRGRVTIKERKALETRACECYEATRLPR
jgi:CRP-like cAMP-binding protein